MKISPAKNTGAVRNALAAMSLVIPVNVLNQSRGTNASRATVIARPVTINGCGTRDQRQTTRFESRIITNTAEMTMALTIQVMPNNNVARLTVCTSNSRNAAPSAKKCQSNLYFGPTNRRWANATAPIIVSEVTRCSFGTRAFWT